MAKLQRLWSLNNGGILHAINLPGALFDPKKILVYFEVVLAVLTLSIAISVWTLYLHHMTDDELDNMGPLRAKLAIGLATVNSKLSFGWKVDIPLSIKRIAQKGFQNNISNILQIQESAI